MKNYKDLTLEEKKVCIFPYPEEAKEDEDWLIRRKAHKAQSCTGEDVAIDAIKKLLKGIISICKISCIFPHPKKAKKDEDWHTRQEAYRTKK